MITVFRSTSNEPAEELKQIGKETEEWVDRVKALQAEYRREVVLGHSDLTGADFPIGIVDNGIAPYGWSKYNDMPCLVPTRSEKGEAARLRLKEVGESPAVVKRMVEKFDVPPFCFKDGAMFYPGFEIVKDVLYVIYNVVLDEKQWDGNEWFIPVKVWEYLRAKDI